MTQPRIHGRYATKGQAQRYSAQFRAIHDQLREDVRDGQPVELTADRDPQQGSFPIVLYLAILVFVLAAVT